MTCPQKRTAIHAAISILTPARGVTVARFGVDVDEPISILTPARGGDKGVGTIGGEKNYFNSHPREGGDLVSGHLVCIPLHISIPTPARGVTGPLGGRRQPESISIPTPARGVTPRKGELLLVTAISIPTPARGVTFFNTGLEMKATKISIPTPARGVTQSRRTPGRYLQTFQFPPPRGG